MHDNELLNKIIEAKQLAKLNNVDKGIQDIFEKLEMYFRLNCKATKQINNNKMSRAILGL